MLVHQYTRAYSAQLLHLVLCMIWNAVGVYQIAQGQQPIGPVASLNGIVVMTILSMTLLILLHKGCEKSYCLVSLLPAMAALLAIIGAFTGEPTNWPTAIWRWAGVAVNIIGLVGLLQVVRCFRANKPAHHA
ncbi:hypothetical protein [Thaumasiovibrio subtropicus]|uniref:hypothetical protein n=1 Tax=Thaumasiovibrio subtropicus TaxID=1891207 RepID=UPI000B3600BA|nr:hypothetical protein [Thaumasiovibrio subtropicus]